MKDELVDLTKERELNLKIQQLESEEVMPNDLWPSIKQIISSPHIKSEQPESNQQEQLETKYYTATWIPWAIAASLVISIGSMTFSWNNLQKAENIYAQITQEQSNNLISEKDIGDLNSGQSGLIWQVDLMEQEYKLARVGLMSRISMNTRHIDKIILKDIQKNLQEIETANQLLKKAIFEKPEDYSLVSLLQTTYQQELNVLTQLAKLDNSI